MIGLRNNNTVIQILLMAFVLMLVSCSSDKSGSSSTNNSNNVAVSGTVSDSLLTSNETSFKPSQKIRAAASGTSTLAGATVQAISMEGKVVATTTTDESGTYKLDLPPGVDYIIRVTKGNVMLKALVPAASSNGTVDINPESSAEVKVLADSIGVPDLGDQGVNAKTNLGATNIEVLQSSIRSIGNFSELASEIAADIAANGNYSATSGTGTVGVATKNITTAVIVPINDGVERASAPNVSIEDASPTISTMPSWSWTSGGFGNSTFRYKLNSSDLSTGATETTSNTYTPETALVPGTYTLYVQEKNAAGVWSQSGAKAIVVVAEMPTAPTAPTVTGTTPATTVTPTWSWTSAGDGNGSYRLKLDSEELGSGAIYTRNLSYTPKNTLSGGEHTLYVQERNQYGQWSLSGSFTIVVPAAGPADVSVKTTDGRFYAEDISAGWHFSIARKSDGTAWGWGSNGQYETGVRGDGFGGVDYPTQISALNNVKAIDSNNYHSIVLKNDGTVWTWGESMQGALGDTIYTGEIVQQVKNLNDVTAVATGEYNSYVVKSDGTVWGWGMDDSGQLGDGQNEFGSFETISPVQALGITNANRIIAGGWAAAAITSDGTPMVWGRISSGQFVYQPVKLTEPSEIIDIAQERERTVVVKKDGTVWETDNNTATQITGLSDITKVSVSLFHSIALKSDGTVWAWGKNDYGRLGDGSTTDSNTPVQVKNLNDVVKIAAGVYHSLAIKKDGSVWAWGASGISGILGSESSPTGSLVAVPVAGGSSNLVAWNAISGASSYNIYWSTTPNGATSGTKIANITGTTYSHEGINTDNTYYYVISAVVNGVESIVSAEISTAQDTTAPTTTATFISDKFISKRKVTLNCDDASGSGCAGIYYTTDDSTPDDTKTKYASETGAIISESATLKWIAVDGAGNKSEVKSQVFTKAAASTASATAGIGQNEIRFTPISGATFYNLYWSTTAGKADSGEVIAGASSPYIHNGLINETKYYYVVKAVDAGGEGAASAEVSATPKGPAPVTVTGVNAVNNKVFTAKAISVGNFASFSLALDDKGIVWAWGSGNNFGALGDGTTTNHLRPAPVSGLSDVIQIAAGTWYGMALKSDGTVWSWGSNGSGQLGDGTKTQRYLPVQVSGLSDIKAIAAGNDHSLALKKDGSVWAWGRNIYGQLGNGTTSDSLTPIQVAGLTGVTQVAIGFQGSVALKSDGTLWAWGLAWDKSSNVPVEIKSLAGTAQIRSGLTYAIAIKQDGTVWGSGRDNYQRLADGSSNGFYGPTQVQIKNPTEVSTIASGYTHLIALKEDGTVWAWGNGEDGKLGLGYTYTYTPTQISSLSDVAAVGAGNAHSLALKKDGTVWMWGRESNLDGKFVYTRNSLVPIQVGTSSDLIASTSNTISWNAVTGATAYNIYWSNTSGTGTAGTKIANVHPPYTQQDVTNGLKYCYVVTALNGSSEGEPSEEVCVTPPDTTPPTVPTPSGDNTSASTTPTWSWTAGEGGNGTFRIKLDDGDLTTGATEITTTSYTPTTALSDGQHTLYLQERDAAGNWSESLVYVITIDSAKPTVRASVTGTTFVSSRSVTLTCDDGNGSGCAAIYYTTNGSTPDATSTVYSTEIAIGSTTTLKFFAKDAMGNASAVTTETYTRSSAPSLTITAGDGANSISWNAVAGATSYNLYWSTTPGAGTGGTQATGVTPPYNHTGLSNGTSYYYVVTAVDANGEGVASLQASGTPQAPVPSAPTGLIATDADGSVTLSWSDVSGAMSYKVYYGTSTGVTTASTDFVNNATSGEVVTGLSNGSTYYFIVTASNTGGESVASSEVSATPQAGTVALSANGFNFIALKADGTVTAWSDNSYGTMGHTPNTNGDVYSDAMAYYNPTPAQISGLNTVKAIAAGNKHTLALKNDGTVWAWGHSEYGELGHAVDISGDPSIDLGFGAEHYSSTPVQVSGLTDVVAIAAGVGFSLALKSDGTVWAWGDNFTDQLGDNSGTQQNTPVQVVDNAGTGYLTSVISVAAGGANSYAVQNDGTLWAWGNNSAGELGLGNYTNQATPTQISSLSNVISVKASGSFAMALKSDGTVWSWGDNFNGQLGDGTTTASNVPVQVSGLTGIQEISAGFNTGFAIKSDGTAWAWGSDNVNQLGDGGVSTDRLSPVQITATSNLVEIVSGDFATAALKSDGTVQMWGNNGSGELGHAPNTNGDLTSEFGDYYSSAAVQLAISPAKAIAASTGISATGGGGAGAVPVSWTAVTGASSYNVYWSTTPGVNVLNSTKITGVSSGNNVTGLTNGTRYYFIVTAVDSNGKESSPSIEVNAVP